MVFRTVLVGALVMGMAACSGTGKRPAAATSSSATATTAAPAPAVPANYRQLYDTISRQLDTYDRTIAAMPPAATGAKPPVAGAELLAANGNRLAALLRPDTIVLVDESLDRLKALQVGGVTLGIKVPMLLGSVTPEAGRYADFYATVADHARARGLVVSVELGVLFCGTVFAQCTDAVAGSYRAFVDDTAAQARIVLDRVRPDFLTVLAEPDTEAKLTGVSVLATPDGAARAVGDVLAAAGPRGAARIGAGAGTWLPTSFAQAIAAQPVDYLDAHVYPANAQSAANAVALAGVARRAGKPLVIDEAWLYKTDQPGIAGGPAAAETVFRQDVFSFWQPLDARFLATTFTWARKAGAAYVSAFWSWQFFTYLAWTPQLDAAPYQQLVAAFDRAVAPTLTTSATTDIGGQWGHEP